jgi:acyl dehydratase
MAVSSKHILEQGPVIAGFGRTVLAVARQQISGTGSRDELEVPGPVYRRTFAPRPRDLIRDYVRHVGGSPREYRGEVPPHLFPQWGFALTDKTLRDVPYPLTRAMNGGCRLEVRAPLPDDEPLECRAQLVDVDDNGRRAVLQQEIITGTRSAPEANVATLYVVVPLGGGSSSESEEERKERKRKKQEENRVPEDAREVARWHIDDGAGLDFAKLTGDFNPIHWIPPAARASGFSNVILHGFSTMARAYEGIHRQAFKGLHDLGVLDVQFTSPLVLPADVGLYLADDDRVFVADAPGGPSYMKGTFELAD